MIAMLTFAFSFGNIWALGARLGVSPWIAPLSLLRARAAQADPAKVARMKAHVDAQLAALR
ncbi:MAG: hypothetical protein JOY82_18820 [Streptosporangiaceae bacterium]|nr:hypothetical protein [Streptosporangiaceae bacterium]MBV9856537.1 hypothetical protein [Streptosporangiaceae bacterium]